MKLALAMLIAGCATDVDGPRLDRVTPAHVARAGTVTITGSRLCGAAGDCAHVTGEIAIGLTVPQVRAVVTAYADDRATIVIPDVAPIGSTVIVATVDGRSSNALDLVIDE